MRRFHALLLADLRERVRSRPFWVVVALSIGLTFLCFPPSSASYIVVGVNSNHRGLYSSAWIGIMLAMLSIWTSLAGFYLVRGNLTRDVESGVWELLEVSPLSRASYLLAKWGSHLLVLGLVLFAQIGVGLVAQLVRAEDTALDLEQLIVPALVFGLPSLALTAMFAIWFDMVPWLRRSVGNHLYFVLSAAMLVATFQAIDSAPPKSAGSGWISDPRGVTIFHRLIHQRLETTLAPPLRICVGCGFPGQRVERFAWPEWHIAPSQLLGRFAWLAAAVAGVLLGVPFLDRIMVYARAREQPAAGSEPGPSLRWLAPLAERLRRSQFGTIAFAELKLTLQRRNAWWRTGLVAALAMQAAAPERWAALGVIAGWVLLTDMYSGAPLRELHARTAPVVYSTAHAGTRVLLARWLVLLTLGWTVTLPAMLRFAVSAPALALAVCVVGVSLASWAMALGALTRTRRVAEVLVCMLAFVGTQDVALLNVLPAPGWTSMVHLASLPLAALLLWIGWPRIRQAAA